MLSELREKWQITISTDGGCCPVCDRFGKQYKRPINKTMVDSLKWLYENGPNFEWVDVAHTAPKTVVGTNQLSILKHWGLIEQKPNKDDAKKTSGIWRITIKGKEFVLGQITIPKYIITYNDILDRYEGNEVAIHEISQGFNYNEVMKG